MTADRNLNGSPATVAPRLADPMPVEAAGSISTATSPPGGWRRSRGRLRRWVGDPLATLVLGSMPGPGAVLRVARANGSWRQIPIMVWPRDSVDYVVALFGITPWVTAIRRGARIELRRRRISEPVRLVELGPAETAEFLAWFVQANADAARRFLADGRGGTPHDGRQLAERHPVFRIIQEEGSPKVQSEGTEAPMAN